MEGTKGRGGETERDRDREIGMCPALALTTEAKDRTGNPGRWP